MEESERLRNGHRCRALELNLSEDAHDLLALTRGFQTRGSASGCSLPGGTAVLPPWLLIIHPAQLGTVDKSHEIAFVLQLDDLRFMGVPFSCTLLMSCPLQLLLEQQRGFWGTGWSRVLPRSRSMGRCILTLPVSLDFSEPKGELLLPQPALPCCGHVNSPPGKWLCRSWLLYHVFVSPPSSPPSSKAQCSCRATGRRGVSSCSTQTQLMLMATLPCSS